MPRVDLKYLHTVTAKGRVYHYAWRGGPRIKAEIGSPAFVVEYSELHAVRVGGDQKRLESLIIDYRKSDEWKDLAAKTRQNWAPWLDRIQVQFGAFTINSFDRPIARRVIKQWRGGWKSQPRTADMGLQVFSRVLSFGVAEGKLTNNMAVGIPYTYQSNRSALIWTETDLLTLEAKASEPVMRAARLAALTGIRQGDLLRLSWTHVKPNSIEIKTGKSSHRKTTLVPLYADLRAFLKTVPRSMSTTVLTNSDGLPWRTGFGSSWNKTMERAGIKRLHFHDLRGTAATRFYKAGLSIREIAEIMTWSEDRVEGLINRYVKRDEILLERIAKLDQSETGTVGVKPSVKPVGNLEG